MNFRGNYVPPDLRKPKQNPTGVPGAGAGTGGGGSGIGVGGAEGLSGEKPAGENMEIDPGGDSKEPEEAVLASITSREDLVKTIAEGKRVPMDKMMSVLEAHF